jgi:hypothetical protein
MPACCTAINSCGAQQKPACDLTLRNTLQCVVGCGCGCDSPCRDATHSNASTLTKMPHHSHAQQTRCRLLLLHRAPQPILSRSEANTTHPLCHTVAPAQFQYVPYTQYVGCWEGWKLTGAPAVLLLRPLRAPGLPRPPPACSG